MTEDKKTQAQQEKEENDFLSRLGADTEEVKHAVNLARMFAPWANPKKEEYRMTVSEIVGVILQCKSMGVNAFNPHEVNIFKDWQGIKIFLAFPIIREWVQMFHGGMTRPISRRIIDPTKLAEYGLEEADFAVETCFYIMNEIKKNMDFIQAGMFDKTDFECWGVGVMTAKEIGKLGDNAAPTGRTLFFKAEKRAIADAIRARLGDPSTDEVLAVRNRLGFDSLTEDDFAIEIPEGATDDQRIHVVKQRKALEDQGGSHDLLLQATEALYTKEKEPVEVSPQEELDDDGQIKF